MSKETGGPAFPRNILDHGHGITSAYDPGMTLRDYFAGKALQGFAADPELWNITEDQAAEAAYRWADAMLKERMQNETQS